MAPPLPANLFFFKFRRAVISSALFSVIITSGGCARFIAPRIVSTFSTAVSFQTNTDLLKEGLPSFLLSIDGLAINLPDNRDILFEATRGYAFYVTLNEVYSEKDKAATLSWRARDYGLRLLAFLPRFHGANTLPLEEFTSALDSMASSDIPTLFWGAQAWGVWIREQAGLPQAVAELGRVKMIMDRVLALDEGYYFAGAHLFLGAYYGSLPVVAGGNPEKSRFHFEQALALGGRRFFMTQVLYAETYARHTFNQELYERLLKEVIMAPVVSNDIAAINALAQKKAALMLTRTAEYF